MRKLSNIIATYEGRFEAAPQLLLHLILLMTGEEYFSRSGLDIYGLITSLAMLGKDLTENILVNGSQDYQSKPFTSKLMMMAKFLPVVLLTTIFRLGSLALVIHHIFILREGLLIIPLKLFSTLILYRYIFIDSYDYETRASQLRITWTILQLSIY